MADPIEVTIDTKELRDALVEIGDRADDLSSTMAVIAESLVAAVSDEYENEGFGAWPALAPSTIKRRRKKGAGAKMMQSSGVLAGSTTPDHGTDFAEAFTGIGYVVYHLEGGPVIPKRNPFEVRPSVFDDAEDMILAALAGDL